MRTKRTSIGLMLVAGLLAGGLSVPAAADANGVGLVVNGIAKVGDNLTTSCTKDITGAAEATGEGIYLPHIDLDPGGKKYILEVPSSVTSLLPQQMLVLDDDGDVLEAKPLRVCGNVDGILGNSGLPQLGPWCGMSKGYNGKGKVKLYKQPENTLKYWLNIYDLGWKASIPVGWLPLIGKYQEQGWNGPSKNETKKDKEPKWGQILGLVSARAIAPQPIDAPSPNSCANNPSGANHTTNFRVDGVLVLRNSGMSKNDVPYRWNDLHDGDKDYNDHPLFCKGSADLNNDTADGKEYKCPYKTKPKSKPKTG